MVATVRELQILFNMLELGMDPQAAVDQPRFCVHKIDSAVGPASVLESHVLLEQGILSEEAQRQLAEKGHHLEVVTGFGRSVFGKAQVIVRDKSSGVLVAGSDPRGDGCAMGW
jgi:gamma-glutamyltranspeptidase/glutathione hydrolase